MSCYYTFISNLQINNLFFTNVHFIIPNLKQWDFSLCIIYYPYYMIYSHATTMLY